MPYTPPPLLRNDKDVTLVAPSIGEVLQISGLGPGNNPEFGLVGLPAGTTVAVAGQPPLSGAILLNAGLGTTLVQAGHNITIAAPPLQAPRPVSVFFPGTLTARTGIVLQLPNPVLRNIDAYFQTSAPGAGTSGAACANVVVSDQNVHSVTLPLSAVGQAEWHTLPTGNIFGEQTGTIDSPGSTGNNVSNPVSRPPASTVDFTASANGQISGFQLNLAAPNAAQYTTDYVRVGLISPKVVIGGTNPTLPNIPWVLDTEGQPAFVDIPVTNLPLGGTSLLTLLALNAPVNIVAGTTYSVYMTVVNSTRTALGTSVVDSGGCSVAAASGNISNVTYSWAQLPGPPYTWTQWSGGAASIPIVLLGGGVGVAFDGLVTVALTLTGAPALPGQDLTIVLSI